MYPKAQSSARSETNIQKQGKRENLCELLLNKFRNKYQVNLLSERELDSVIRAEITKIINEVPSLTERDLNELDLTVQTLIQSYRKETTALTKTDEDAVSTKSYKSQTSRHSRAKSTANLKAEVEQEIRALYQGKTLGMTDAEWNAIVQQDYKAYTNENKEKFVRLSQQREQMREELQKQVALKTAKDLQAKEKDQQEQLNNLKMTEKKLIQDEIQRNKLSQQVKSVVNISSQFEMVHKRKQDELVKIRQQDAEERKRIEESIKNAEEADAKIQEERRNHLRNITEEDRKAKLMQKILVEKQKAVADPTEDIISKVFHRQTHQAYDRRAKSDKVVDFIAQNFLAQTHDQKLHQSATITSGGFNSQFDPEVSAKAEQHRKQQTKQMKSMLDMQVQLQQQEKESLKQETRAIGQKLVAEHALFEQEQQKKKQEQFERSKQWERDVKKQLESRSNLLKAVGSQVLSK